jgi:hypothetical protein
LLPTVLKGEVRNWYLKNRNVIKKFGDLKRGTTGSFVSLFLSEFAGEQQQYEWGQELSTLKQTTESIAEFNKKWKSLDARADPGNRGYPAGKVKNYLDSIRPELQFQVRLQGPKSVQEAMEAARNAKIAYKSIGNPILANFMKQQTSDPEVTDRIR